MCDYEFRKLESEAHEKFLYTTDLIFILYSLYTKMMF